MKQLLFVAVFIAGNLITNGQSTIKGVISDAKTNTPIAGVSIVVPHSSNATITDNLGKFVLQSKKAINSIIISSIGYSSQQIKIISNIVDLNISLIQSANPLTPVEVQGTRMVQSFTTLSSADINRFSGLNLQDALNTIPGVNMQSRTPWGGQRIILRGYYPSVDNGRNNSANFAGLGYQMFIDNVPVTDATGTTVMDDIDFFNLGKVEVIKGPSPIFGSYIAGAVNLFNARPAINQSTVEEQVIGGSYGLFRNNLILQTSNGNTDYRVCYGHQAYNGFRTQSDSKKDYITFTSNFISGGKQTLSTYFSYNNSNEGLAGEIDSTDFYDKKPVSNNFYILNKSHVNMESFRTGITDKYQFNDLFSNQSTLFVTGSVLDQAFAHGFTKNQNLSLGGRSAFMFQSRSKNKMNINGILGFHFIKTSQDSHGNFFPPFVQPPFTATSSPNIVSAARNYALNYNLFSQWTLTLPGQVSLITGGSLNFIEFGTRNLFAGNTLFLQNPTLIKVFKPTFTPSISLIKVFQNNISVYVSSSTGYAPATLAQMKTSTGEVNAELKPEKAVQYEIGTKGSFGGDKKLSFQIALFDLDVTNRLIQQTANSISFYTNAGEQKNLGAEAYLSYNVGKPGSAINVFRPWISYSYSHFTYTDFKNHGKSSIGGDTLLADYSGNKVAAVPANILNVGLDLITKAGLYFNGTYRYVDKAPVTFDNQHFLKSYDVLSVKLGYRQQLGNRFNLDIFAGADNLLGNTYYSFLFIGQNIKELAQGNDPNIRGGGGDGYILPAPYKATFYGGLTLKYNL